MKRKWKKWNINLRNNSSILSIILLEEKKLYVTGLLLHEQEKDKKKTSPNITQPWVIVPFWCNISQENVKYP